MASSSIHALSLRSLKALLFHSMRPAAKAVTATSRVSSASNVGTTRDMERFDKSVTSERGSHPTPETAGGDREFWGPTGVRPAKFTHRRSDLSAGASCLESVLAS